MIGWQILMQIRLVWAGQILFFYFDGFIQTVLISCGAGGEYADSNLGHVDGLYALYAKCLGGTDFEISYDNTDSTIEMKFKDLGCESHLFDSNEIVRPTM